MMKQKTLTRKLLTILFALTIALAVTTMLTLIAPPNAQFTAASTESPSPAPPPPAPPPPSNPGPQPRDDSPDEQPKIDPFASLFTDPVDIFIDVLYKGALHRELDQEGFDYWTTSMREGIWTYSEVAYFFYFLQEIEDSNLTDEQFVERLYNGLFGRFSESEGLESWLALLDSGISKEAIFYLFIASDEFAARCEELGFVT